MARSKETIHPAKEQQVGAGLAFILTFKLMKTKRSYIVPITADAQTVLEALLKAMNPTADVSWSMENNNKFYPTVDLFGEL